MDSVKEYAKNYATQFVQDKLGSGNNISGILGNLKNDPQIGNMINHPMVSKFVNNLGQGQMQQPNLMQTQPNLMQPNLMQMQQPLNNDDVPIANILATLQKHRDYIPVVSQSISNANQNITNQNGGNNNPETFKQVGVDTLSGLGKTATGSIDKVANTVTDSVDKVAKTGTDSLAGVTAPIATLGNAANITNAAASKLGSTATDIANDSAKLAQNIGFNAANVAANKTTDLLGKTLDKTSGIILGVFNAGEELVNMTKNAASNYLKRREELKNLGKYFVDKGIDDYFIKVLQNNFLTQINESIKIQKTIHETHIKSVDELVKNYRIQIMCRKDLGDFYNSNNGIGAPFNFCKKPELINDVITKRNTIVSQIMQNLSGITTRLDSLKGQIKSEIKGLNNSDPNNYNKFVDAKNEEIKTIINSSIFETNLKNLLSDFSILIYTNAKTELTARQLAVEQKNGGRKKTKRRLNRKNKRKTRVRKSKGRKM